VTKQVAVNTVQPLPCCLLCVVIFCFIPAELTLPVNVPVFSFLNNADDDDDSFQAFYVQIVNALFTVMFLGTDWRNTHGHAT